MKQAYAFLLLFITLLSGCSEPEDYSPVLRGTVSGQVTVYNEYNEPLSAEGVTVQVLGEGFTMEGNTDQNGHYKIANVPHGEWTYLITKPGFRWHYKNDFNFFEEKATLDFQISRAPSFYVERVDLSVQNNNIQADVLLSEAVPAGKEFNLVTYIGNTKEVYYDDYLLKNITAFTATGERNVRLIPSITVEGLKSRFGFKSGDTVYFKVFPGAARIYGYWEGDEYRVDSGINPSLAVTFTLTLP